MLLRSGARTMSAHKNTHTPFPTHNRARNQELRVIRPVSQSFMTNETCRFVNVKTQYLNVVLNSFVEMSHQVSSPLGENREEKRVNRAKTNIKKKRHNHSTRSWSSPWHGTSLSVNK